MKPAKFGYVAAQSIDETVSLLTEYGEDARVLAGGQSLIPMMNFRLARPAILVDIGALPSLDRITSNGDLTIGTLARQQTVGRSLAVRNACPVIAEALGYVGHVATRNRGTFGGSAAHADPAAEIPCLLVALDATLVAHGPRGERQIAAEEFFRSYYTTDLAQDEILTEIRIPTPPNAAGAFLEVSRRRGDFALVAAAVAVERAGEGVVKSARVALAGVAEVPVRAIEIEALLAGNRLADVDRNAVRHAVSAALDPPTDVHASRKYRKHVAGVLVARALEQIETDAFTASARGGQ